MTIRADRHDVEGSSIDKTDKANKLTQGGNTPKVAEEIIESNTTTINEMTKLIVERCLFEIGAKQIISDCVTNSVDMVEKKLRMENVEILKKEIVTRTSCSLSYSVNNLELKSEILNL